tara:strand:- start:661 stop:858 length:198 start_codon:yes stop_codon:yes gene_type:complete
VDEMKRETTKILEKWQEERLFHEQKNARRTAIFEGGLLFVVVFALVVFVSTQLDVLRAIWAGLIG